MVEENKAHYNLNAKWDAYIDLGVRRFVYSTLTGALAGLILFRSPTTRWASVAFGAGVAIGSTYTECYRDFDRSTSKLTPVPNTPVLKEGLD